MEKSQEQFFHRLKYCTRLTMEHIMIGNKNQIDIIAICQSTRSYLDAEFLWSLEIEYPIELVTNDMRSNLSIYLECLIILGNKKAKKFWIYRYQPKNMKKRADLINTILLDSHPQQIFFLKDQLAIIYQDKIQLYVISP